MAPERVKEQGEILGDLGREEAIERVMAEQGEDRENAEFIVALMLGDTDGDLIETGDDGGGGSLSLAGNPFSGPPAVDLKMWNPEAHPRWPKGTPKKGGQFLTKYWVP